MGDKRVILVAGASAGIGEATAKLLAKRGHRVFATSRDAARVTLKGVEPLSLDVFEDASVHAAVAHIAQAAGRLDAVVYSAGFYVAGAVEETPMQDVKDQLEAYFFGAVRLTQAVLPQMRAQGFGRLVFMSSTAGVIAIPFHAAYSASKGALGRWTEAFAYEVEPFGISASYIEAGPIRTNAPNAMRPPPNPMDIYAERRALAEEGFKDSINSGLPPKRIAGAIRHAVEDKRPRVRYRVGLPGRIYPVLQAVLGERRFRALMKAGFKMD